MRIEWEARKPENSDCAQKKIFSTARALPFFLVGEGPRVGPCADSNTHRNVGTLETCPLQTLPALMILAGELDFVRQRILSATTNL